MVVKVEKPIEQIKGLKQYLPEENQEELEHILAYGEKIKAEGERKKKSFWSTHDRCDFLKLLSYNGRHKDEMEGKYNYLDGMNDLEKKKFVEEYLHNDMLYSGELIADYFGRYGYENWKQGKVSMNERVLLNFTVRNIGVKQIKPISKMDLVEGSTLDLTGNHIGNEGAKLIAENMRIKEGLELDLDNNHIGVEGAKAIAENMKLKCGVNISLRRNQIGDEGAKAIAENMKFEEGVNLDLSSNQIGDEGAKYIIDNMKLKKGVTINLEKNGISGGMKQKLKEWEMSHKIQGINCRIKIDE